MASIDGELYVTNPLNWAVEQNKKFQQLGMPYGYIVEVETGTERYISSGQQIILDAHYRIYHPELYRERRIWTDFVKDRDDPDSLEEIAHNWVKPMTEALNLGLSEGGDALKIKSPLQNR